MNILSLFLYFADIIGNIATVLSFIVFAGLIGLVILLCSLPVWIDKNDYRPKVFSFTKKLLFWIIITAFVMAIIPSKQTMYMIAASELGETVINTPKAQELMDLIEKKVREELSPQEEKDTN